MLGAAMWALQGIARVHVEGKADQSRATARLWALPAMPCLNTALSLWHGTTMASVREQVALSLWVCWSWQTEGVASGLPSCCLRVAFELCCIACWQAGRFVHLDAGG